MIEIVSQWIKISNREDFGRYKILLYILIAIFVLISPPIFSYAFIIIFISISAFQITSLSERFETQEFLYTSILSSTQILIVQCLTSLINNLYSLVVLYIILFLKYEASIYISLSVSLNCYIFTNFIGILIGNITKKQLVGIIIITGFIFFSSGFGSWIDAEKYRYISMFLQLFYVKELYIANFIGIVAFDFIFFGFAGFIYITKIKANKIRYFKYSLIVGFGIIVLLSNFIIEYNESKKINNTVYSSLNIEGNNIQYKYIDKEMAEYVSKIILSIEDEFMELGFDNKYNNIILSKEIFYPSKKVKIFKTINENDLLISFISPAMYTLSAEEYMILLLPNILRPNFSEYNQIQSNIIRTIEDEVQYRAITKNKYKVFSSYDISKEETRNKDRKELYRLELEQLNDKTKFIIKLILETYPEKGKDIYNFCILENKFENKDEFWDIMMQKYSDILKEYPHEE